MANTFIEQITPLYILAVRECKTTVHPVVLIAQAIHESEHGTTELARAANNIAGLKYKEPFVGEYYEKKSPEEQSNGEWIMVLSKFCKFPNIHECIKYHANFYQNTTWRKEYYKDVLEAKTIEDQCKALDSKYATDSKYSKSLIKKINENNLKEYVAVVERVLMKDGLIVEKEDKGDVSMQIVDRRKQALGYPGHGAYPRRHKSGIKNIVWHYTWSDHNGDAEQVIKQHEAYWRSTHGWDIGGYHYYIDKKGKIVWNYDLEIVTYGASKANPYTVHISLESKGNYTKEQIVAREWLTLKLMKELGLSGWAVKGHKEMPGNSTTCPGYSIAQLDAFRADLEKKSKASTQPIKPKSTYIDLPIKPSAKPFDQLKVGQTVTIREGQNYWYVPQTNQGVKPSKDFKGDKDVIEKAIDINASYSKRAYLLKNKRSWILEQDVVEARQSWTEVPVKEDNTDKGIAGNIPKGNYVFIEGKYYELKEAK